MKVGSPGGKNVTFSGVFNFPSDKLIFFINVVVKFGSPGGKFGHFSGVFNFPCDFSCQKDMYFPKSLGGGYPPHPP